MHVLYRRAGDDMPAAHLPEEIEAARDEGVRFHVLVNPTEVLGDANVTGLKLQQQRLADFDDSARRKPIAIGSESYVLNVEVVIPAIGQVPDVRCLTPEASVRVGRGDVLAVGEALETSRSGVFAAGDAVNGPATIVEAVAQGNLAAIAVDHWIGTGKVEKPQFITPRADVGQVVSLDDYAQARRPANRKLHVRERDGTFREVELGMEQAQAMEEAKRCLRCDLEWLDLMGHERPKSLVGAGSGASGEAVKP